MERKTTFVVVSLVSSLSAFSATAAHAAASARLVYVRGSGAEQCPAEEAVRAAVSTRLGYDPFFAWARDALFVEITRAGVGFRAEIKLVDADNRLRGDRELSLDGDDCGAVVEAMGLTISLVIDPSNLVGSPPPAAAPTPPPTPPPPTAASAAPLPEADRPATAAPVANGVQLHAGVGAFGVLGAEPTISGGVTVFVGARWRALSLDLEGRADVPTTAPSAAPPGRVQSGLFAGALVPCVHVAWVFGCPLVEVGWFHATSVGTSSPTTATDLWLGTGGRLGVELPATMSWFFRAYGELLGTMRRDTLAIGGEPAYRFPAASGGLGAALVVRFP